MLELKNIQLKAGEKALVQNPVAVHENSGQTIVFFGRNGTGKTTLLRTIAGRTVLRHPQVFVNQKSLAQSSIHQWSRLVCYLGSHDVPGGQVKTYEYLLSARLGYTNGLGLYAQKDHEITEKWIEELGIESLLEKPFAWLSDGEKQLVNIARAFIYDTPVILLDEPTSNLDVPNKRLITEMLHRYAASENKLIIYTSHDYFIAEKYCRNVWYISHGQEFFAGAFEDLSGMIREDFGIG